MASVNFWVLLVAVEHGDQSVSRSVVQEVGIERSLEEHGFEEEAGADVRERRIRREHVVQEAEDFFILDQEQVQQHSLPPGAESEEAADAVRRAAVFLPDR